MDLQHFISNASAVTLGSNWISRLLMCMEFIPLQYTCSNDDTTDSVSRQWCFCGKYHTLFLAVGGRTDSLTQEEMIKNALCLRYQRSWSAYDKGRDILEPPSNHIIVWSRDAQHHVMLLSQLWTSSMVGLSRGSSLLHAAMSLIISPGASLPVTISSTLIARVGFFRVQTCKT